MMEKTAYLTIDDAATTDLGMKCDMMIERGIPAIIFSQGDLMEQNPDQVVYAIQKGFVIANHSYEHPKFSELTLDEAKEQITRTEEIIDGLYGKAGTARPARLFRFPYGDKGDRVPKEDGNGFRLDPVRHAAMQDYLKSAGFIQPAFEGVTYRYYKDRSLLVDLDWYWTYDVAEYIIARGYDRFGIKEIKDVYARMELVAPEEGLGLNTPGSDEIILIHDNVETTQYWAGILDALLEKGLKFKLPDLQ